MINELLEPRYFSLATGYAVNLLANTNPGDVSKCRAPSWRVAGKSTPPPIETRLKTPRVLMSPDDAYFNGADKRAVNASPRMCAARSSGDTHRPKYPPEPVAKGSCRKASRGLISMSRQLHGNRLNNGNPDGPPTRLLSASSFDSFASTLVQ